MNTEQLQKRIEQFEAELAELREVLAELKPIDMVEELSKTVRYCFENHYLSDTYAEEMLKTVLRGARDRYVEAVRQYPNSYDRPIAAVLGITVKQVQEWSA